ncbi:sensor domain-containing diguanylate cyclase [Paenibacillus chungangensis]|uniref:Sensor domain-containing diguanylate cyclase n=1 Tax=Paenibacillus chungangensis TaxID=696535 RepID=A0ABW3HWP9_9BACL
MKLSLKNLILFVALLSVILTMFSSTSSGYRMSQQTLIENTLETNRVYAQKLANTTDVFFKMMLKMLEESSNDFSPYMEREDKNAKSMLLLEADHLKHLTNAFNSVVIVAADGEVLATSPQTIDLLGKYLDSEGGLQALNERKPFVSKPYLSMTGRLIIFISHPVFAADGDYLGLVGGSIYLKEDNILYEILGEHFYKDDSYVYVVDEDGRILYHQDQQRINDQVQQNPVVAQLMNKQSGAARVTNTKDVDMLAGYAYIPTVEWGVVSQRSADAALAPATDMMNEMMLKSLPYLLISLVLISFISKLIAQPLQNLARVTESSTENNQNENMKDIRAWYYEAIQLKKAVMYSLGFLHEKVDSITHQSKTDPLTKLTNRRTLDEQTIKWVEDDTAFSIVLLDIDHFKRVNDTYGHAIGDEVLKFLAQQMREVTRKEDVCCRYGGEEFVLLLKDMNETEAYHVAEKLRTTVENSVSPSGDKITLSAGIASYPATASNLTELFNKADEYLYEAKKTGRNRCISGSVSGSALGSKVTNVAGGTY